MTLFPPIVSSSSPGCSGECVVVSLAHVGVGSHALKGLHEKRGWDRALQAYSDPQLLCWTPNLAYNPRERSHSHSQWFRRHPHRALVGRHRVGRLGLRLDYAGKLFVEKMMGLTMGTQRAADERLLANCLRRCRYVLDCCSWRSLPGVLL